ncbi:hypothetical protein Enr13x_36520 [Stieleria neptunia]|uniref:Uncharacterized protein n=1 Tax=Stieleria neptunia TaxID=2527979 RepID=A0A518HSG1_9BACT|nr:hypothetical protein Enr13x_36520 [Stieleria neptunia]
MELVAGNRSPMEGVRSWLETNLNDRRAGALPLTNNTRFRRLAQSTLPLANSATPRS